MPLMGGGIERNCAQGNIATDGLGHSYCILRLAKYVLSHGMEMKD